MRWRNNISQRKTTTKSSYIGRRADALLNLLIIK
mgnify:CR=1 FL=1